MPLVSYALTTVANVEEALEITPGTKTSLLTNLINRATDMIETYCDRRFKATTYTNEIYDGTGTRSLVTKQYPINSVTSLSYRNTMFPEFQDSWTTIDTDLHTYTSDGIIYYSYGFNLEPIHYRITYNAGYTTIPYDLEQACIELVSYFLSQTKDKGMQSETLGNYSYTRAKTTLSDSGILDTLDSYKRSHI